MKTLPMQIFLDVLAKDAFGRSMSESIAQGICVACGGPKGEFADAVSEAEYKITGMCQKCQDIAFAIPEGDE